MVTKCTEKGTSGMNWRTTRHEKKKKTLSVNESTRLFKSAKELVVTRMHS